MGKNVTVKRMVYIIVQFFSYTYCPYTACSVLALPVCLPPEIWTPKCSPFLQSFTVSVFSL